MNLLLDENVSPTLVGILAKKKPPIAALALRDWRGGALLNRPDEEILRLALLEKRVLLTFDVNSIPELLTRMAVAGEDHAGVILVSSLSFSQDDLGALARALVPLTQLPDPWLNRSLFLQPRSPPSR